MTEAERQNKKMNERMNERVVREIKSVRMWLSLKWKGVENM